MRVRSRAGVRLLTSGHALPLAPGVAQPPPHQTQCRLLYLLAPSAYPTPNDASNVKPPRDANGHIHSIARSRLGNYSIAVVAVAWARPRVDGEPGGSIL